MNQITAQKQSKYWITTIILFFLGWVLIYAGRSIVSPVMGEIRLSFGLTGAQTGGIMSLFFIAYTLLQIPSGILGDKVGRKLILVGGFFLYAISIGLVSLSTSYFMFIALWMFAGAAQGTYYGPQYALSSEAIPKKWLALGSAIIGCGMSFGIALGYNLSSIMVSDYGTTWKMPFFAVSLPIFALAILMFIFLKEKAPGLDKDKPAGAQAVAGPKGSFWDLFKNRNLVIAYFTIFCSIYGFFVIITWLPYYLENERGMDKVHAANIASIVPWISIIGTIIFSYISDRLGKRKPIVLFMMPLSLIAIFGIVYSTSEATLIAALVLYGFIGKISLNPILLALCADYAPRTSLSTAFGLYNFFGMSASTIAPFMTGYIADVTGSLNAAFYFAAVVTLLGVVAMLFVKETKKPE